MYRQGNYSLVIDANYNPLSMQEMLVPFTAYKDAFDKSEAAYDELTEKADTFKYLAKRLEDNPDSEAARIYKGYADELAKQAQDLAQNGLSMGNRRALTDLKRRYQGEIGQLEIANKAMDEERKLRRQMSAKDSSMLYAVDNLDIDQFLGGNTPNLYGISGNDLYTKGAAVGKAASSRMYKSGDAGSVLGGYYKNWKESRGVSQESIAEFMNSDVVQQEVDNMLKAEGVTGNLTGANLEKARQQVLNGIYTGIVYEESNKPIRDEGKMSAATKEQYALQREQMTKSAAQSGLTWDDQTKSWKYSIDKDPSVQRAIKLQELKVGQNGGTSSNSAKTNPQKFRELLINNGTTSNGTVLTGIGENMDMVKLATNSTARYVPFYGDAFDNDAKNGFDVSDWENSGISGNKNELKPYKFSNLKSDEAKQQIRDHVQEMIPDVVEGLTPKQIDEVIGYMDFVRDYDALSDNHFRLSIPGTDEEGKIVDANKFNGFLSKVNRLRIKTLKEGLSVPQQLPAQTIGGNSASSPLQVLPE